MNRNAALAGVGLAVLAMSAPAPLTAQSARSVIEEMVTVQQNRWNDVENYTIEQLLDVTPMSVPVYFERAEVEVEGRTLVTFRQVPLNEWQKRVSGTEEIGAEEFENMADAYEMLDGALKGSDPIHAWAADVVDLQGAATFLRAGAEAERSGAAYADENPDAANLQGMHLFAQRAELVGQETHLGRPAYRLHADDLSDVQLEQPDGDADFTLRSATMWVDSERHVPLQMTMNLEVDADGSTSPVALEIRWEDYREFGSLYEATRQVMSIKGLNALMASNEEDREKWEKAREDMAKAQEQMEEMREQIDQLPSSVQGMVRGQMEKAMRQMEMMMNDGAIETVLHRTVYAINEGPPGTWSPTLTPGGQTP